MDTAVLRSPPEIGRLGTILSVWAHPDDETFLCAGLMSAAAAAGQNVTCITATRGEKGSQDHVRWPPETMGEVREREMLASMAALGVGDHRFLDYIDGECADVSVEEGSGRVVDLLEEVDPDTILTFGPEGMTDHPDHKAVHRWVVEAVAGGAEPRAQLFCATTTPEWRDRFYESFQRANVFGADTPPVTPADRLAIDFALDGGLLERKMRAIKAHESQIDGIMRAFGEDVIREAHTHERFVAGPTRA